MINILEMSVTFNGETKIMKIDGGVTSIDVQEIYSRWKDWLIDQDNIKYLPAFRYVGGDPTVNGQRLGTTYFLTNGWRIEPFSGDHVLVISGNIFTDESTNPFVKPSGMFNILITNQFSNLTTIVETSTGGGGSNTVDASAIAHEVWNTNLQSTPFNQSGTIGNYIRDKVLSVKKYIGLS